MTFPVRVNCSRGQGGVSAKSLIVNVVRVDGVSLNSVRETRLPPPRERGYVAAYTFFYTSYSTLTTLTLLTINSLRNIGPCPRSRWSGCVRARSLAQVRRRRSPRRRRWDGKDLRMPIRPENRSRYPADWRHISARIRERAGNKCEWCEASNGEPHPVTGSKVVLTVAHLDHQPENCADDNLAALCQRCHNRYDAPVRQAGMR
jgi:hypothetical protein